MKKIACRLSPCLRRAVMRQSRVTGLFVVCIVVFGYLVAWTWHSRMNGAHHGTNVRAVARDETPVFFHQDKRALVTLFTAFDDNPDKTTIRYNVLRNWSLMRPEVKLILFVRSTPDGASAKLASAANFLGWKVIVVRRVSHSGKPFIKELYEEAAKVYDTPFHGFVSGDVLFDGGLLLTLRQIEVELPFLGTTMVIGRRTNVFVAADRLLAGPADVAQLAKESGRLYRVDALDYFVVSSGYPWQEFRDVTVGRPGFDNYIVGLAVMNSVNVIDATGTIVALHQCIVPLQTCAKPPVYTDRRNILVIGKTFDYNLGSSLMAKYETALTHSGLVEIRERQQPGVN